MAFRLSLILGILYLTFQAFPIIFAGKHGFNPGQTGLSFLGVFVGLAIAMASMAYWNRCVEYLVRDRSRGPYSPTS